MPIKFEISGLQGNPLYLLPFLIAVIPYLISIAPNRSIGFWVQARTKGAGGIRYFGGLFFFALQGENVV